MALASVALQDHIVRNLNLNLTPKQRNTEAEKRRLRKIRNTKSVLDTGRTSSAKNVKDASAKEYVLDPKPAPPTLAEKLGLVDARPQPLTEDEWQTAKDRTRERKDFEQPCPICRDHFGSKEQVLLSCKNATINKKLASDISLKYFSPGTHVFHRACLHAFERFTGKKSCPICRHSKYQTRVVHEGTKYHRARCATMYAVIIEVIKFDYFYGCDA